MQSAIRAYLVKVRLKPFGVLGYAEDLSQIATFGRNASKTDEAAPQNSSHKAVTRVKEADLASPSPTLLLAKQALRQSPRTELVLRLIGCCM